MNVGIYKLVRNDYRISLLLEPSWISVVLNSNFHVFTEHQQR